MYGLQEDCCCFVCLFSLLGYILHGEVRMSSNARFFQAKYRQMGPIAVTVLPTLTRPDLRF